MASVYRVAEVFVSGCVQPKLWPSKTQNNLSLYFGNQTLVGKLVAMCSSKFFCTVFPNFISLHACFSYIFIQTMCTWISACFAVNLLCCRLVSFFVGRVSCGMH
uniref:Uncharacterized protein n=1 Tax=Aegilops tauschii subsp. strangulata TaxID=200361 RepID=A0A453D9F6_AEGTS